MLEDDGGSFAAGCALSFSRQPSDQPGPEPVMVRIVVDLTKQDISITAYKKQLMQNSQAAIEKAKMMK